MHRNYFTFERQVKEILPLFKDLILQKCFTYRKDELVLHFFGDREYYLKVGLNLQKPYILHTPFHNIKDPLTTFFDQLSGMKLLTLYILAYDKRIMLDFGDLKLQAIFYGKHPNVILLDAGGGMVESFKKQTGDVTAEQLTPLLLPHELSPENLRRAIGEGRQSKTGRLLAHEIAGFNNQFALELCHRCGIDTESPVNRLTERQLEVLAAAGHELLDECSGAAPALYHDRAGNIYLGICRLSYLQDIDRTESFTTLNEAWDRFIYLSGAVQRYDRLYHRASSAVEKRLAYLTRTHRQLQSAQQLATRRAEANLKGKLLQAFAHEIPKGETFISLPNIFTDGAEKVDIKLNPAKSVHENARIYFNKYKDSAERDDQLQVKIDTLEKEISDITAIRDKLQEKPAYGKLEKITDELENRHLLQPESNVKKSDTAFIYSFNRLLLEKKWEVLIGKNAANNDLLTFKFSRKFDLWFHAQSVPGSHVVIRLPNRNEHPPHSVIEDAARIAAYNSTARNSGTVPVNYTEVRYVRKPRKGAPGQVLITNEKTLFVTPKKLG